MNYKLRTVTLAAAAILLLSAFLTGNDDPAAREIVRKVDELYRSTSSYGLMEMEIVTPHWKRTLKIESWSLGKDKTFMRILEPKKERGMATLKLDREMWNFLPKIRRHSEHKRQHYLAYPSRFSTGSSLAHTPN